ncbi:MAG: winged helix DNA-binding domain-containing protein [Gemmatimonadota bacterium]
MALSLTDDQVRRLRMRAQWLDGRPHDGGVAAIAGAVVGIQAQATAAADYSLRARGTGLTVADVKRAVVDDRSVVRTWCMRGTLHLVAAEDLQWLLPVLAPTAIHRSRRRMQQLGLDAGAAERGIRRLAEVLADGAPRTRADLAAALAHDDIPLEGQALPHLVRYAALRGVICNGPLRGGKDTYVPCDAWLGSAPGDPPEDGLARLAGRYLAAYGPASLDDFAYWSGLPKGMAGQGWDAVIHETVDVDVAARWDADLEAWVSELNFAVAGESRSLVRLLGMFDAYLLGYRRRGLALAPEHAHRLVPGTGGMIRAALLVDGRVRGVWTTRRSGGSLEILVEPFGKLPADVRRGVEAEVEGIGRFLDVPATLRTGRT